MNAPRKPGPVASIVVATFHSQESRLRVALGSALEQSRRDIEILVSDDSPDDGLRALVESLDDPRLRYHRNTRPRGVAANHEAAFARARGHYIAILNHDDWLAPTFIERLAHALDHEPRAVLAFCDHWLMNDSGRRLDAQTEANSQHWGRAQLQAGLQQPWESLVVAQAVPVAMGTLFRRAALRPLPAQAGPAYDLWLAYLLCSAGSAVWYEPQRLSAWRVHGDSLTAAAGIEWLRGATACWEAMAGDPRFEPFAARVRRQVALGHYSCARRALRDGHPLDGLHHAWRSLRTEPLARLGARAAR